MKKIIESFNFNDIKQDHNAYDVVESAIYDFIFKKILNHENLTNIEQEALLRNAKKGYPYKYKIKDHDELHNITRNLENYDLY